MLNNPLTGLVVGIHRLWETMPWNSILILLWQIRCLTQATWSYDQHIVVMYVRSDNDQQVKTSTKKTSEHKPLNKLTACIFKILFNGTRQNHDNGMHLLTGTVLATKRWYPLIKRTHQTVQWVNKFICIISVLLVNTSMWLTDPIMHQQVCSRDHLYTS